MNRRTFTKEISSAIISYALLDSLFLANAFGQKVKPIAAHWAKELATMCNDLKIKKISQLMWQEKIEQLFNKIELKELLQFINFGNLIKGMQYPDLGVATKPIKFPPLDGIPEKTVFVKTLFGLKKGRAIIPHGHSNMASAHLVLKGEFSLKHYDKVEEDATHLFIQPTIDKIAAVGSCSSISDERDNIHWFIANSETAFTFDIIMLNLNEQQYDIHNIDIAAAENLSNGLLRAKKLDVETALKKYGKKHH